MSLRSQAVQGTRWTALAAAVAVTVQPLQFLVIAHFLSASEIGVFAVCLFLIGILQGVSETGFSNAAIQSAEITRGEYSSLFWFTGLVGVAIGATFLLAAPAAVLFFGDERLRPLLLAGSPFFVIAGFAQMFRASLQRELRFGPVAVAEILSTLLYAALSIGLAAAGHGPLALVWGLVGAALARTLIMAIASFPIIRPRLHFALGEVSRFVRFAVQNIGAKVAQIISARLDALVIAWLLGTEAAGWYFFAQELCLKPVLKINPVITRVAFAAFSRIQDQTDRLRRGYRRMLSLLAAAVFPVPAGIAAVSPLFFSLFLPSGWHPAQPLVAIFALAALCRTVYNPSGTVVLALGRADIVLRLALLALAVNAVVFPVAAHFGLGATAWASAVLSACYLALWLGVLRRLIGLEPGDLLRDLRPVIAAALAMVVVVSAFVGSPLMEAARPAKFTLAVAAGATLYTAALFFLDRGLFRESLALLRDARVRRRGSPAP